MARLQSQNMIAATGVDLTSDPVAMPLNRAKGLYNLLIDRQAQLRAQIRLVDVLPQTSPQPMDGVGWYYQAILKNNQILGLTLTDLLVWVSGGFLFIAIPNADPTHHKFTGTSIVFGAITGYTFSAQFFVGQRVRFASLLDELLMIQEGGILMLRFYATATLGQGFFRAGIQPPLSTGSLPNLTLATAGTGLTGTWQYKLTFEDEHGRESSPTGALSITLANQGAQATLNNIYASPPTAYGGSNLVMANLYRNTQGAPSTFYRIARTTVPIAAGPKVFPAGSYFFDGAAFDDAPDASITSGALCPAPGEFDPPNPASIIGIHKNRVFLNDITNAANLQVSVTLSTTQFTQIPSVPVVATDGVRTQVGTDQADPITALLSFGSVLGIFKRRGLFFLYGEDLSDFIIRPVHERGCIAPDSCVRCDNALLYLSDDGVYAASYNAGDIVTKISKEIEAALRQFTQVELEGALGWFVDNRYHITIANTTFVYDFDAQGWTAYLLGGTPLVGTGEAGKQGSQPPGEPPGGNGGGGGAANPCSVTLSPTSLSFGAAGGTANVTVLAANEGTIDYSSSASWLFVSGPRSGNGIAVVSVTANTTGAVRTGIVTICSPLVITVAQQAAAIACNESVTLTDTLDYAGQTLLLDGAAYLALTGHNFDVFAFSAPDHALTTHALGFAWEDGNGFGSATGQVTISDTLESSISFISVDATFVRLGNFGTQTFLFGFQLGTGADIVRALVQYHPEVSQFQVNAFSGGNPHQSVNIGTFTEGQVITFALATTDTQHIASINGVVVLTFPKDPAIAFGTACLISEGTVNGSGSDPNPPLSQIEGWIFNNFVYEYCFHNNPLANTLVPALIASTATVPDPAIIGGGGPGPGTLLVDLVEYWSPVGGVWTGRHAGHNGSLVNGPSVVADAGTVGGFAVVLNGTDQQINVTNFAGIQFTGDFTWAGHFLLDPVISLSALPYLLSKASADFSIDPYGLWFATVGYHGYVDLPDAGPRPIDVVAPTKDVWTHIAMTFDHASATAILYLNTVNADTETTAVVTPTYDSSDLVFGAYVTFEQLKGRIADMQCWSRVLSAGEIFTLSTTDYSGF